MSHEHPLQEARRHVREGEQLVTQQVEIIELLRRDGIDTCGPEELLATFEQMLRVMREHLAEEERMHSTAPQSPAE